MSLQYLTLHQWGRRPARAVLTVMSVSIAVTALLGTSAAQSTVRRAYHQMARAVEGPPALEIVAAEGGRFSESSLPSLSGISGIKSVTPLVTRGTKARVSGKRLRTIVIGLDGDKNSAAWEQMRIAAGRPPEAPNEVVLADNVAKSLEIELESRVVMITSRGIRSATLVGLADAGALRDLMPGATLAMPSQTLQQWFALEGEVDRARILLKPEADRDTVKEAIARLLPEGLSVQLPAGQMVLADGMLRSIEQDLTFSGILSLVMAAFLIFNTLRMNFSERKKQLATLRALGATRGQMSWLVVSEALWIGTIGAALGIPGAIMLAFSLGRGMEGVLRVDLPTSSPRWDLMLLAFASAPLVSVVAALAPAWQSRRISPIEEMVESAPSHVNMLRRLAAITSLVAAASASLLYYLVIEERIAPVAAVPACCLSLLALVAILPEIVRPLLRAANWVLSMFWSVGFRLAAEQLLRRPTRTGLTAGVLVIVMINCLGLGNAVLNIVEDVRTWYRRSFTGDYFLINQMAGDAAQAGDETAEEEALADLLAHKNVGRVMTFRLLSGRVMESAAMCMVRDFPSDVSLPWSIETEAEAEIRSRLAAGEAVVASVLARRLGVRAGDSVRVEIRGRAVSLPVAAIVNDYNKGGMVAFFDRAAAAKSFDLGPTEVYMVESRPGTNAGDLEPALQSIGQRHGLLVQSFAGLRDQLDQLINGIVVALWILPIIGFLVGGFAVANTLTMSVLEQTRELGLLRIVGMTRGQLRTMVLAEALLLGFVGVVLGAAAGVGAAMLIHACTMPLLGYEVPFVFHFWLLAANAGGGMLVTLLSAWLPCRRAVCLDVLEAIAYE